MICLSREPVILTHHVLLLCYIYQIRALRALLFLFLLVEALAVEDMNFHNIKNKKLLISRMGKGLVDNVWHPLTLDSKWLAEHPSVVPTWDVLNISRKTLKGSCGLTICGLEEVSVGNPLFQNGESNRAQSIVTAVLAG